MLVSYKGWISTILLKIAHADAWAGTILIVLSWLAKASDIDQNPHPEKLRL
jgi:hypothetical protein